MSKKNSLKVSTYRQSFDWLTELVLPGFVDYRVAIVGLQATRATSTRYAPALFFNPWITVQIDFATD